MAKVSSEYWSYDDPRWANDPAYGNPETMKYVGPWEQVLQATGFRGKVYEPMIEMQPDPNGGFMPLEVGQQYTPQAKAAIDSLRASGYDLRWKHPDKRTFNTYWGFVTPDGVQDIKIGGSDIGDMIKPMIKVFGAGLGLAGLGAGINSLLGGAGAEAGAGAVNALAGGSADLIPGVMGSGQFSAAGGLGGAGGVLSAADLATLPSDVLGQAGSLPQTQVYDFASAPTTPSVNALAEGAYQNLTPTELLQLDYLTTPTSSMIPMPMASPTVTPLTQLPPSLGPVTPPTFEFTLADPTAAITSTPPSVGTIADLAGIPADAGFAAGMGVDAGMNALNLGAGAGAVKGVADVAATGATGVATGGGAAVPTAATGAATGGDFLSGMSDVAAAEGAGVAGTGILTSGTNIPSNVLSGGSILDKAVQLVTSPVGQAVVGGVGSVVGGVLEANAAEKAAETQSQAAANALALQREMFEYQKGLLEPYRTAGTKALERLSGAMGLGGPGSQQQMLEMDPGYGFRLGEGLKALERMQASRGNFLSGGALKAGQRFAQDTASQEYGNAYNRLANIAGLGQTAGTQMGGAAAGFGTSAGNIMGQEANALAAGRMGRASAYTGAIGGALGSFENYLNRQQRQQMIDIYGRRLAGGG